MVRFLTTPKNMGFLMPTAVISPHHVLFIEISRRSRQYTYTLGSERLVWNLMVTEAEEMNGKKSATSTKLKRLASLDRKNPACG